MNSIIDQQIRSYGQTVFQAAHLEAMRCRDVEDLIGLAVALFDSAKNSVRRWQQDLAAGAEPYSREKADSYVDTYRVLGTAFDEVARLLAKVEADGFKVDGAAGFRQARGELAGLLAISLDRLDRSDDQVRQGDTRPLGDVLDEIRRRTYK